MQNLHFTVLTSLFLQNLIFVTLVGFTCPCIANTVTTASLHNPGLHPIEWFLQLTLCHSLQTSSLIYHVSLTWCTTCKTFGTHFFIWKCHMLYQSVIMLNPIFCKSYSSIVPSTFFNVVPPFLIIENSLISFACSNFALNMYATRHAIVLLCTSWICMLQDMPLFCYVHHEYVCYKTCHCSAMYIMNMYATRHAIVLPCTSWICMLQDMPLFCYVHHEYVCYKTCHCSAMYIMNMYATRHAIVLLCTSWICMLQDMPLFCYAHHEYVCYKTCHCSAMYIMNMYATRHAIVLLCTSWICMLQDMPLFCHVHHEYVCYKTCHCSAMYIMNMYATRHAIVLLCTSWICMLQDMP